MCCTTHEDRDRMHRGIQFTRADSEHFRCRCTFGVPCSRQHTAADLLCDWCRGQGVEGHERTCYELMGGDGDRIRSRMQAYGRPELVRESPWKIRWTR
jgi:hypothetical protein